MSLETILYIFNARAKELIDARDKGQISEIEFNVKYEEMIQEEERAISLLRFKP